MSNSTQPPIPVHVVTGALGVGKTTAIAKLLASKPEEEYWVVILNEFTDTGIDAITLASAARGAYDVRVIPGGCLCCTGELDFRRTLRAILTERRPARILIEPTGIGHPGAVLEELRAQERGGAIRLLSTLTLVDPKRLHYFDTEGVERDQIEVADALVLSKLDTATDAERTEFAARAQACFPSKRLIGEGYGAVLAAQALQSAPAAYSFELPARPESHSPHVHNLMGVERDVAFGEHTATARAVTRLGRHACGWTLPRELTFNRVKLEAALADARNEPLLRDVERLKAVLRTGIEHWTLFNLSASGASSTPCGWRQDSRIEVQITSDASVDWRAWDAFFMTFVN